MLLLTGPQSSYCHSPHLLDLLHFLKNVGSDDGDHHLDGGKNGQDGDPDDLVVLKPVQEVVDTGGLLHSPGGVLIPLPANKKSISDLPVWPGELCTHVSRKGSGGKKL